jgi:hypothetical protein
MEKNEPSVRTIGTLCILSMCGFSSVVVSLEHIPMATEGRLWWQPVGRCV